MLEHTFANEKAAKYILLHLTAVLRDISDLSFLQNKEYQYSV